MNNGTSLQTASTAVEKTMLEGTPDMKTQRYDRQLRLWAASGQRALESAHVLVISASATSTSILKNLVLPGIGHFTLLDPERVTAADAGNNFFLQGQESIGRWRAEEAVRLLGELNEGVHGVADVRSVEDVLEAGPQELGAYTLVIAHNLDARVLERLARLLWEMPQGTPLVVVRSAGFFGEFAIQYHEHTEKAMAHYQVIESHSETAPSLRLDVPFPALLEYARSLDFDSMDSETHAHVPYVLILVRAWDDWRTNHGYPPNSAQKEAFKRKVMEMRRKSDEENFDEALSNLFRVFNPSRPSSELCDVFADSSTTKSDGTASSFFRLARALRRFVDETGGLLPLTRAVPDMKATTEGFLHLQTLYGEQADKDAARFWEILREDTRNEGSYTGEEDVVSEEEKEVVAEFLKNAHGICVKRGSLWSALDQDPDALAAALLETPKEASIHLAFSAMERLVAGKSTIVVSPNEKQELSREAFIQEAQEMVPREVELPGEFMEAIGELIRAPTADLPNTAAFLGGLVAQEVIKMITKQYIPISGRCVVDLIDSWTGMMRM